MVNIAFLPMDDYGLIEPTDVGTMTVEYDSKMECKKPKFRWDQDEVICMLDLIKENNMVPKCSITKMSTLLCQLMKKQGYNRSDKQIQVKLTMLRKNYLTYEKQKILYGDVKECQFYKELCQIYKDTNSSNGADSDDYDSSSTDECLVTFPNDHESWQKGEIQKMLSAIKAMKLKNELSLTFFSPVAVRMISEAMTNIGYDRSIPQVKNALINLRSMYIDYKIGTDNNENPTECMFFPCLESIWGREYKKCRTKEKRKLNPDNEWSIEETIVLLTLVKDLDIAEEAYENTEKAAQSLSQSLAENGYNRTVQQVRTRLANLKDDFVNVHTMYAENDAVKRFPFYTVYKKLFEEQYPRDVFSDSHESLKDSPFNYKEFCKNAKQTSQKINKDVTWETDEVRLLLKTVRDLTTGKRSDDSLEDEKLQKIKQTLKGAGHRKTTEQIKHKLTLLKESYMKCNLEDLEKDISECPFYNELHEIFRTSISDERYEIIKNVLTENGDINISKFSDDSYPNVKFDTSATGSMVNDKVTVLPNNKSLDTWFPVESIMKDVGLSASSTLPFNDLSGVSNKEHEQVIEEAILATMPDSSDIHVNSKILNDSIPCDTKHDLVPENEVPAAIFDHEITTTVVENEMEFSEIYNVENTENSDLHKKRTLSESEGVKPPKKKLRIIDDERIGKNKILLRPVDSMNPNSLNMTNNKFVRLIVANDPKKTKVDHITAHIEPLNINTAGSVSSGMSSPSERPDILKQATEKFFGKFDCDKESVKSGHSNAEKNLENKFSEIFKEAMQTMMKYNEVLQEKHHTWMEKQFEIQRKHDEEHKKTVVNELRELRSIMTVLLEKQAHVNNEK